MNLIVAYPKHSEKNQDWQFPCEIAHHVCAAVTETFMKQAMDDVANETFQLGKPLRRERRIGNTTNPGMLGRIGVRQGTHRPESSSLQRMLRTCTGRRDGGVGVDRGKDLWIKKDLANEMVAGHDPMIELVTVEDRGSSSCIRNERIGIGEIVIIEWIEFEPDLSCFYLHRNRP